MRPRSWLLFALLLGLVGCSSPAPPATAAAAALSLSDFTYERPPCKRSREEVLGLPLREIAPDPEHNPWDSSLKARKQSAAQFWPVKKLLRQAATKPYIVESHEFTQDTVFLDVNGDGYCDLIHVPEDDDWQSWGVFLFIAGPDGRLPSRPIDAYPIHGPSSLVPVYVKGDPVPYLIVRELYRGGGGIRVVRWNPEGGHITERRPQDPKGGLHNITPLGWFYDPEDPEIKQIYERYYKDPFVKTHEPVARLVLRFYSNLFIEQGRQELDRQDYNGAWVSFNNAMHIDQGNPYAYYFMGMTKYLSGQFRHRGYGGISGEGAYYWFERALELNIPEKAQTYYNLGLAYEAAGEVAKAKAAYEAYLKLEPRGARAEEVRQRLESLARGVCRPPVFSKEMFLQRQETERQLPALKQALGRTELPPDEAAAAPTPRPGGEVPAEAISLEALKAIDRQILEEAQRQGKSLPPEERDWMVAYKAKFPQTSLEDMVRDPERYKQLPWVQQWLRIYRSLPE